MGIRVVEIKSAPLALPRPDGGGRHRFRMITGYDASGNVKIVMKEWVDGKWIERGEQLASNP